jgi:Predicted ATPase (AAA+ superfamily)
MEKHFKREEAGFIVLYGRRRVGKTELINRFIKDKKHVYFLARRESAVDTFNRLSKELFKVFRDELLIKTIPYSLWLQHRHDGNRSAGLSVTALWQKDRAVERAPEFLCAC